jgi:hypothetical protein
MSKDWRHSALRVAACLLAVAGVGSTARAGQVYGTLLQDGKPVPSTGVTLTCGRESKSGSTDPDGVYRLFVRTTGSCILVLEPRARKAAGSLYSYDRPTAYDFDMVNRGGTWVLAYRKK